MRQENIVQKFDDIIIKFNNRLKFFDLDTLNIACDNFYDLSFEYGTFQSIFYNSNFQSISKDYSFLQYVYTDQELINAKNTCAFVHYAGKPGKPWRMKKPYNDYQKYIDKIPKELRKYTFRDFRKRLFSKD
jgi:UDP-glucose:(galactosyl)LPS alpha-1,2-glucosyltransferase